MGNINEIEGNVGKQRRWDDRYLGLAGYIAKWSKDPNAKVGAVIVNQDIGRIIAVGFNGFPSNVEDSAERLNNKEVKLKTVIHAEQNALLFAGREARGCDVYVAGKPVCNYCAILLIQAGIKRVIAAPPKQGTTSRWDESGLYAAQMFAEAGVQFTPISDDQLQALGLDKTDATTPEPPIGVASRDNEEA